MSAYFKPRLGRPPLFDTAEEMYAACCEYFQWVVENPLYEDKAFQFQGEPVHTHVVKPRAMTLVAMCTFLGCSRDAWENYRKREGFAETCELVDNIIYTQKFELAAADLLNVNLIARDLGLRDRSEIDHKSSDGTMAPTRIELVAPDVSSKD
jgi:hypothetical protein